MNIKVFGALGFCFATSILAAATPAHAQQHTGMNPSPQAQRVMQGMNLKYTGNTVIHDQEDGYGNIIGNGRIKYAHHAATAPDGKVFHVAEDANNFTPDLKHKTTGQAIEVKSSHAVPDLKTDHTWIAAGMHLGVPTGGNYKPASGPYVLNPKTGAVAQKKADVRTTKFENGRFVQKNTSNGKYSDATIVMKSGLKVPAYVAREAGEQLVQHGKDLGEVIGKGQAEADGTKTYWFSSGMGISYSKTGRATTIEGTLGKDFPGRVPNAVMDIAKGADANKPELVRVVKTGEGTVYWFAKEPGAKPAGVFEHADTGAATPLDLKNGS